MKENTSSNYFYIVEKLLASNKPKQALRNLVLLREDIPELDIRLLAKSYFWESLCHYHLNNILKSRKTSLKGIQLFESIGDFVEISKLLRDQGLVSESISDFNSAIKYLNESIEELRDHDVIDSLGISYSKMGQVYYKKNQLIESKYYCELGYNLCKEGKNAFFLVTSILPLAKLYYKTGNHVAGLDLVEQGIKLQSKIDRNNRYINLRRHGELNLRKALLYLGVNLSIKSFYSLKVFVKNCLTIKSERTQFKDDPDIKVLFLALIELGYLSKIEKFLKTIDLDIREIEREFHLKLS